MKRTSVRFAKGFHVLLGDDRSQAASMVIAAGECEGGGDNHHRGADQWLYVAGGSGEAVVNGRTYRLRPGSLILIARGDTHEIRNTGRSPLKTLNVYVPPPTRPTERRCRRDGRAEAHARARRFLLSAR
jgi:mannose-6-phosphate isomerase-like protein (cupin superfamily)